LKFACRNGFTCNAHHKGFASVHVNVGCNRAKPRDKSEIEDSGHELEGLYKRAKTADNSGLTPFLIFNRSFAIVSHTLENRVS
jgi:hypothetical protein